MNVLFSKASMFEGFFERLGAPSDYAFGFQSWYFGYALALFFLLLCLWAVKVGKLRRQRVLWLPVCALLVFTLGVFGLRCWADGCLNAFAQAETPTFDMDAWFLKPVNSMDAAQQKTLGRLWLAAVLRDSVCGSWLRNVWKYALFELLLSVGAFFLTRRRALPVAGGLALSLALLALFAADRQFALSARLLFQPGDAAQYSDSGDPERWEYEYSGLPVQSLDNAATYVRDLTWTLDRPITLYAEADTASQPVYTTRTGATCDTVWLRASVLKDRAWSYGVYRVEKAVYDGVDWPYRFEGYYRKGELLRACGVWSGNGALGWLARRTVYYVEAAVFSDGVAVPPGFMGCFMPLEIGLFALLALLWALSLGRALGKKRVPRGRETNLSAQRLTHSQKSRRVRSQSPTVPGK